MYLLLSTQHNPILLKHICYSRFWYGQEVEQLAGVGWSDWQETVTVYLCWVCMMHMWGSHLRMESIRAKGPDWTITKTKISWTYMSGHITCARTRCACFGIFLFPRESSDFQLAHIYPFVYKKTHRNTHGNTRRHILFPMVMFSSKIS